MWWRQWWDGLTGRLKRERERVVVANCRRWERLEKDAEDADDDYDDGKGMLQGREYLSKKTNSSSENKQKRCPNKWRWELQLAKLNWQNGSAPKSTYSRCGGNRSSKVEAVRTLKLDFISSFLSLSSSSSFSFFIYSSKLLQIWRQLKCVSVQPLSLSPPPPSTPAVVNGCFIACVGRLRLGRLKQTHILLLLRCYHWSTHPSLTSITYTDFHT